MSLQAELAAKALVYRKTREAEDKAIKDERFKARQESAGGIWTKLKDSMHKAAGGGATQFEQSFIGCLDDDPVINYIGVRCREESLTMTDKTDAQCNTGQRTYIFAWGSGE